MDTFRSWATATIKPELIEWQIPVSIPAMTPAVVSFAVAACLVFGLFGHCLGANILVLEGVPSPSHHIWMRTLTTELARLGHNVTSLSADVEADAPKNLHYIHLEKMYAMAEDSEMMEEFISMNDLSTWSKMFVFGDMFTIMLQGTVTSEGFTTLMNYPDDFPFDLIIYDTIAGLTSQVFVDKFKNVPVITVCPYPLVYFSNYISGSPYFPAFVPNQNALTLENTFCGRFENFLSALFEHFYIYNYLGYVMERDLNQVVKLSRPLKELYKRTKLVMPNYNPAVDLVQPIMPMVVPVGGLQIREPKPLPEDLDVIFRKAKMGVVLFSLGSNVKSEMLGVDRLTEIVEALRQFPEYDFIWKIDPTGMDLDIPKHVHIRKWLPQNDILAHNKTVLFMSHGGGLSTQETTWFGVPMLGFPVLMDQFPVRPIYDYILSLPLI